MKKGSKRARRPNVVACKTAAALARDSNDPLLARPVPLHNTRRDQHSVGGELFGQAIGRLFDQRVMMRSKGPAGAFAASASAQATRTLATPKDSSRVAASRASD
jgi:hypothetical protein